MSNLSPYTPPRFMGAPLTVVERPQSLSLTDEQKQSIWHTVSDGSFADPEVTDIDEAEWSADLIPSSKTSKRL